MSDPGSTSTQVPTQGGTQGGTTQGSTQQQATASTADALVNNPAANKGNVLNYIQVAPPGIFNPINYTSTYDAYVINIVFDRLIEYVPVTLDIVANMAEYTADLDASTLTFNVKPGIKFHDGTGELTAEDVAFTLRMIADPQYDGTQFPFYENLIGMAAFRDGEADIIEGIVLHTAPPANPLPVKYEPAENDPYKITLHYDEMTMSNIHVFANYGWILPRHYYEKPTYSDFLSLGGVPMGYGPFKFTQFVPDQYIEMDKFAEYWKCEPKVDKIIYQCVTNASNIPLITSGDADLCEFRDVDEDWGLIQGVEHVELQAIQGATFGLLKFRCDNPLTADINIRKAFAYGFDRATFVEVFGGGRSKLTYAMVPRSSDAYPDEADLDPYAYNPEKAGQLLDEAGWLMGNDGYRYKDGKRLVISYTGVADNLHDGMLTAMMVEDLKKIGVECTIRFLDWASYMATVRDDPETQVYGHAFSMSPDPYVATTLLNSTSPSNQGRYNNPEYDKYCDMARREKDPAKAVEYFRQAYKVLNEDVPLLFMYDYYTPFAINKRVQNVTIATFINWTHDVEYIEIIH